MTNSAWKKIYCYSRNQAFIDEVLDQIEQGAITTEDAKTFLDLKKPIYGLKIPALHDDLKTLFQQKTGLPYPENRAEELENMAGDTLVETLDSNKEKYGPSFSLRDENDHEIIIVTEQAIRAMVLDPDTLDGQALYLKESCQEPMPTPAMGNE